MALLDYPRVEWNEAAVTNFHEILLALQEAFGMDLSGFRIPEWRMKPMPPYFQRMPRTSRMAHAIPMSNSQVALAKFARQQIETLYLLLEPPVTDPEALKMSPHAVRAERAPAGSQAGPGNAGIRTPAVNPDASDASLGEAAAPTNYTFGDSQERRTSQAPTSNPTSTSSDREGAPLNSIGSIGSPEDRLQSFIRRHAGTTYADVKYSAKVHTSDFQDWRHGELKSSSVMSLRIEDVLRGKTPLKKKPGKRRDD